jgi:uncharacterized membrane protein HdeD (DUF308 family)
MVLTDMQRAVKDALGNHWRLLMLQGVAMLALGCLAIAAPVVATLATDLMVGWIFLASGVIGLIAVFSTHDVPAFLWSLVTAALSIATGILLVSRPLEGAVSLTIILVAFLSVEGVFQIATSIAYRKVIASSSNWMIVSGIADLAMAAIIVANWPVSAAWAIGLLVGINLVTSGWAIVMAAFAARSIAGALEPATAPAPAR